MRPLDHNEPKVVDNFVDKYIDVAPPIAYDNCMSEMHWYRSWRCDPQVRQLADRHYNRRSIGAANFVPPGRCLVLTTENYDAFWVTSWQYPQYVKHAWTDAWVCSAFRNESAILSSELIAQAVAATVARWADVPSMGMITFIDTKYVRRKRDYGRCYRKAGWKHVGYTKSGLVVLQIPREELPIPMEAKSR